MSIRPTKFGDIEWEYFHDEFNHGGALGPSSVTYAKNTDGTDDYNHLNIPCPEGDGVSYWPVGGGADALMGQTMFCIKEVGLPQNKDRSVRSVSDSVKQRVIDTDGEERWVMDEAALTLVAKVTGRSL